MEYKASVRSEKYGVKIQRRRAERGARKRRSDDTAARHKSKRRRQTTGNDGLVERTESVQ